MANKTYFRRAITNRIAESAKVCELGAVRNHNRTCVIKKKSLGKLANNFDVYTDTNYSTDVAFTFTVHYSD